MGVMLYKLCYFSLPFGESALAIQNGTFTFPENPSISDEIKSIISKRAKERISVMCLDLLLTSNAKHRPNIFQASYLAFSAANKKCPVFNIEVNVRTLALIFFFRNHLASSCWKPYKFWECAISLALITPEHWKKPIMSLKKRRKLRKPKTSSRAPLFPMKTTISIKQTFPHKLNPRSKLFLAR